MPPRLLQARDIRRRDLLKVRAGSALATLASRNDRAPVRPSNEVYGLVNPDYSLKSVYGAVQVALKPNG